MPKDALYTKLISYENSEENQFQFYKINSKTVSDVGAIQLCINRGLRNLRDLALDAGSGARALHSVVPALPLPNERETGEELTR